MLAMVIFSALMTKDDVLSGITISISYVDDNVGVRDFLERSNVIIASSFGLILSSI